MILPQAQGPDGPPYKRNPISKGKTILLVDDFCTQGNSFEAGRAFIEKTGANVICLGWLKTINRDYVAVAGTVPLIDPYVPYTGTKKIPVTEYRRHLQIPKAPRRDLLDHSAEVSFLT